MLKASSQTHIPLLVLSHNVVTACFFMTEVGGIAKIRKTWDQCGSQCNDPVPHQSPHLLYGSEQWLFPWGLFFLFGTHFVMVLCNCFCLCQMVIRHVVARPWGGALELSMTNMPGFPGFLGSLVVALLTARWGSPGGSGGGLGPIHLPCPTLSSEGVSRACRNIGYEELALILPESAWLCVGSILCCNWPMMATSCIRPDDHRHLVWLLEVRTH